MYGIETTRTEGAEDGTVAGVTAAVVLDELAVASGVEVGDDAAGGMAELGVPGGQSDPASAGGVHGITSKKTGEH